MNRFLCRFLRNVVLLSSLLVLAHACKDPGEPSYLGKAERPHARPSQITFTAPEPTPIAIFWIDSAGNLGLRGATAVIPGVPDASAKLADACRGSAVANGNGTLTVCLDPAVGKSLAEQLGLDVWTSGTSAKP